MSAHIMCLTSSGGIPLFTRKKDEGDPMSFTTMASLNGIHMFLKSHDVELLRTEMPDTTIAWKEFEKSVVLIAIASGTTKYALDKFLQAVFDCMVLIVGIEEIKNPRNIERLKRDLRGCNAIIDKLLECLDIGDKISAKTDFLDMTDTIMCTENHLLQTCLESYVETLDSTYGCILIHGCVAVATDNWWSFDPIERKLLILAITAENNCTARELPVFLPNKSPNVAFRLVSITLVNYVEVLALVGPSLELNEIEKSAMQCWKNSSETLRIAEQTFPRNFPLGISLDPGLLGFLLVNFRMNKFILSRNSQSMKNRVSGSHRLDIIRTFYYHAVEVFLLGCESEKRPDEQKAFEGAKETYWCSEYHKCHGFKEGDHIFCGLYTSAIPTHTMRLISQKTLKLLLADKSVCW